MPSNAHNAQLTFAMNELRMAPISQAARPESYSRDELANRAGAFIREVEARKPDFALISCSKQKMSESEKARLLYISPLFRKSIGLAERLEIPAAILSAKHGLIDPNRTIKPYDLTLSDMSTSERLKWAKRVADRINCIRPIFFTGSTYSRDLAPLLAQSGRQSLFPLLGLSMGRRLAFLSACHRILDRKQRALQTYGEFENIARNNGFEDLETLLRNPLPTHGVYFFFDPREKSRFSTLLPRLVRVGTHGVSFGSKATLRDRLRTHFGTAKGQGNHRSSIFRLHVGQALIERHGWQCEFPCWGKPSSGGSDERRLEQEVSAYMRVLKVLWVEIQDESTKENARAFVEKNVISLFSEDKVYLENSSTEWLGRHSRHALIRESGLWNIRCIGDKCNFSVKSILQSSSVPNSEIDAQTSMGFD